LFEVSVFQCNPLPAVNGEFVDYVNF